MRIEMATEYDYWKDPENCWKSLNDSDLAKIIKISCGNDFVILKGEGVYSHSDRDMAVYRHEIEIVHRCSEEANKVE